MSYNPNIPLVTDPILKSYFQLRANFQTINRGFGDNHIGMTADRSIAGKHRFFIFRPQTVDPTTSAIQTALYTKIVNTTPQVFFRPRSNQTPIQLSYTSVKADKSNTQYSFIAGPFIIYGGLVTAPTNGLTINLTPASTLIHVDLTMANVLIPPLIPAVAIATNITGSSFDITYQAVPSGSKLDVYYFAVGIPT